MITNLKDDITSWSQNRNAWIRMPFLIWFGYVLMRHLQDPQYQSILGPLNLGIHEFGHLIFSFTGQFWSIAGGTIVQLFAPFYGVYNFYIQKDYFSMTLCFGWLPTSFFHVATYAADARSMSLQLVTPFGGDATHDWNFMLSKMGLLNHDQVIAFLFRSAGFLSMMLCFLFGGWVLWQMLRGKKKKEDLGL